MSEIKILNTQTINLGVNLPPELEKKYAHLVPKKLVPVKYICEISGISNATANALRRTIGGELLVSHMNTKEENIKTNDTRIIPALLLERIKQVPILQSTPIDAILELNIINKTASNINVYMRDFKITKKGTKQGEGCAKYTKMQQLNDLPFNETTIFCELQSGCELNISNILIDQHFGYNPSYMMSCAAFSTAAVALDQRPKDIYDKSDKDGIFSGISNPREWRIHFTTNGIIDPKLLLIAACDNIISRASKINNITTDSNGIHLLIISNESDTIGNLFTKFGCEMYEDLDAITYDVPTVSRDCIIKIKTNTADVNTIIMNISKSIINTFTIIRDLLND